MDTKQRSHIMTNMILIPFSEKRSLVVSVDFITNLTTWMVLILSWQLSKHCLIFSSIARVTALMMLKWKLLISLSFLFVTFYTFYHVSNRDSKFVSNFRSSFAELVRISLHMTTSYLDDEQTERYDMIFEQAICCMILYNRCDWSGI